MNDFEVVTPILLLTHRGTQVLTHEVIQVVLKDSLVINSLHASARIQFSQIYRDSNMQNTSLTLVVVSVSKLNTMVA